MVGISPPTTPRHISRRHAGELALVEAHLGHELARGAAAVAQLRTQWIAFVTGVGQFGRLSQE